MIPVYVIRHNFNDHSYHSFSPGGGAVSACVGVLFHGCKRRGLPLECKELVVRTQIDYGTDCQPRRDTRQSRGQNPAPDPR